MELPFQKQQFHFLLQLADYRTEYLDPFFRFLNYFDTIYFLFFLIPMIWIGFSSRWGIRVFYLLLVSGFVNTLCKELIQWPRPTVECPGLGLFLFNSPGFPSGGAQTAALLGGLLIASCKSRKAWIIGLSYILLISFSRLYLGVHYPIDVLGGWVIGFSLLFLFLYLHPLIETFLKRKGLSFSLGCSLFLPLAAMTLYPHPKIYYQMGCAMGVGTGIYFSLKNRLYLPTPKEWPEALIRICIGIAGLFVLDLFWPKEEALFAGTIALGLWISLAASPFCKWALQHFYRQDF